MNVVIPSTTMAITSAIHTVAIPSATDQNLHQLSQNVVFHLPQQRNVAIPSATMAKIISHITTTWQKTSANNIKWFTNY